MLHLDTFLNRYSELSRWYEDSITDVPFEVEAEKWFWLMACN